MPTFYVVICLQNYTVCIFILFLHQDSLTLIDKCKTGESTPPSILFEEWGKPGQNLKATVTPSPSIHGKAPKPSKGSTLFGISSKKVLLFCVTSTVFCKRFHNLFNLNFFLAVYKIG